MPTTLATTSRKESKLNGISRWVRRRRIMAFPFTRLKPATRKGLALGRVESFLLCGDDGRHVVFRGARCCEVFGAARASSVG